MIKGVQRANNWLRLQPSQVKVTHKLEASKRNLFFMLARLWFVFRKNRLLFWGSIVTGSILLGGSLALLTPLLSKSPGETLGDRIAINTESSWWQAFFKIQDDANLGAKDFQYQVSRPINILLVGIEPLASVANTSSRNVNGTSDTILLLRLDPQEKSLKVLSIPKDSQVVIPEIGLAKISLANTIGGLALSSRVVSRTLHNVPIERYVSISVRGLQELVDQLGGIDILVPQRMLYEDVSQKLKINLQPGWQTLSGEQAVQFAQFRNSQVGDLDRVQRQQILLKALRDRLTNPTILPRLPQLVRTMQNYVDTNLSLEEMLALGNFAVQVDEQNFQMVMLPGDLSPLSQDPSSYWLDDAVAQNRIMSEYFDLTPLEGLPKRRSLTSLKIAIQNASGQPILSQQMANYLKYQGFENVYIVSDWSDLQRETEIIVQKGNIKAAIDLQKVLGLGKIEAASTGDLDSQLTIRVGKNWSKRKEEFVKW